MMTPLVLDNVLSVAYIVPFSAAWNHSFGEPGARLETIANAMTLFDDSDSCPSWASKTKPPLRCKKARDAKG